MSVTLIIMIHNQADIWQSVPPPSQPSVDVYLAENRLLLRDFLEK
jgi:hypothetical protein